MIDRRARRALEAAIAGFTSSSDGPIYVDELGPAVYRLEPPGSECVALACLACRTVTIKPGSPRLPELAMNCQNCGRAWDLRPPAEVVAFGKLGLMIATGPGIN